jgi:MFS family permease
VDNPLIGQNPAVVEAGVRAFAKWYDLEDILPDLLTGARITMDPEAYRRVPGLTDLQLAALGREENLGFWGQTKELRTTIFTCAIAAIVQGWDQSSINGANLQWPHDLGFQLGTSKDLLLFAFINAAPYLFGAICGSWLCDPLTYRGGRRFAIFFAGFFCFVSTVGSACISTWQQLLACRVLLGIGMGAKASVVPVYAAEVAPAHIRGSVVMNWQVFDAFGIFLGFSANLAFYNITSLAWRLMLAAPCLPAIPLLCLIYTCPESPRFLIRKRKFRKAYKNLVYLNETPLQAARELYLIHVQNEAENSSYALAINEPMMNSPTTDGPATNIPSINAPKTDQGIELQILSVPANQTNGSTDAHEPLRTQQLVVNMTSLWQRIMQIYNGPGFWNRFGQLFSVLRMRTALLSAVVVMVAQQLCGVNVIAFYSSTVFSYGNAPNARQQISALWLGWGFGITNFLFAFPAYFKIDKSGRRPLLLATIPLLAITLLAAAFAFKISENSKAHNAVISLFVILFAIFYSFGLGPVPFTYSAEVFPLGNREVGMSFAVFWNLLGAGILSLTVPSINFKLHPTGMLGLFAGLNIFAWLLVYFLVYETKQATLEELKTIFSVETRDYIRYQFFEGLPWLGKYFITLGQTQRLDPPYRLRRATV